MDKAFGKYQQERITHWNQSALRAIHKNAFQRAYHQRLSEVYRFHVESNSDVLELGSGTGDLLASLNCMRGVGVDFSREMIDLSNSQHKGLSFVESDAMVYKAEKESFDYILMSDLLDDLFDAQRVLENAHKLCKPKGRLILNCFSRMWEGPLNAARAVGLATPVARQNWFSPLDVENILYLTGWEVIRRWEEVICPIRIPLIEPLMNKVIAKLPLFRHLCLSNFIMARPCPEKAQNLDRKQPSVSIIIPARNEEGNVPDFFTRTPKMGSHTGS